MRGFDSGDRPPPGRHTEPSQPGGGGEERLSGFTRALIAGAFVMGLGVGVYFSTEVTTESNNVASTEIVDRRTPNSEVCMANGYSAMVFDQRIFVSFNPFNVYVVQPEVKPGCILRRSNFGELERRNLVAKSEVESCKKNMNTFAFVGDLNAKPEVSCVYHSENAENQFIIDPKKAVMGDGYQAREEYRY